MSGISEDESILIEIEISKIREKLMKAVLQKKADIDNDDINTFLSNLTINTVVSVDNNSIATEGCNICFSTSTDLTPFNFKLRANCECAIMGCFDCWSEFYKRHRKDEMITCPKCRRDITAFLKDEGFVNLRRCSQCRRTGHNIVTCPDVVEIDNAIYFEADEGIL
jgi:hypothetical protein